MNFQGEIVFTQNWCNVTLTIIQLLGGFFLAFGCFVPMIADHYLVKKSFDPMIADQEKINGCVRFAFQLSPFLKPGCQPQ
jgi:hypothetical protein